MFEFDLNGLRNSRNIPSVEVSGLTIKINGCVYTIPDVVMLVQDVEYLRKENTRLVDLLKTRSSVENNTVSVHYKELENIIKDLEVKLENSNKIVADQEKELYAQFKETEELKREVYSLRSENDVLNNSIDHYQKLIENNLVSIRCKELEKVVKDLEVIIQEQQKELDIRSDKIHNLQTELNVLEDTYEELLEVKEHMIDHVEEQQAIIEYQKKDIERLVRLNGDLQKELEFKNKMLVAFLHHR